jgi:hypothetical protein
MTHFLKTLTGRLQDVKLALQSIIESAQDYAQRNHTSDAFKLLIPQQYVAKIIGVGTPSSLIPSLGGNMIKEITNLSGGALIKILTDKEKEKEMSETVVSIAGNLAMKISAAGIIASRITEFKHDSKAIVQSHPSRIKEAQTPNGRSRDIPRR